LERGQFETTIDVVFNTTATQEHPNRIVLPQGPRHLGSSAARSEVLPRLAELPESLPSYLHLTILEGEFERRIARRLVALVRRLPVAREVKSRLRPNLSTRAAHPTGSED
jgi:hypothetical protein